MSIYGISEDKHEYLMAFYRNGLTAIIMKWVDNDCFESPEYIMDIINMLFRNQTVGLC